MPTIFYSTSKSILRNIPFSTINSTFTNQFLANEMFNLVEAICWQITQAVWATLGARTPEVRYTHAPTIVRVSFGATSFLQPNPENFECSFDQGLLVSKSQPHFSFWPAFPTTKALSASAKLGCILHSVNTNFHLTHFQTWL